MTLSANDDLLNRELSIEELEAVAGGSPLMSGAPNSINGTLRVQPAPPHYCMGGGSQHTLGLRLF